MLLLRPVFYVCFTDDGRQSSEPEDVALPVGFWSCLVRVCLRRLWNKCPTAVVLASERMTCREPPTWPWSNRGPSEEININVGSDGVDDANLGRKMSACTSWQSPILGTLDQLSGAAQFGATQGQVALPVRRVRRWTCPWLGWAHAKWVSCLSGATCGFSCQVAIHIQKPCRGV